MTHTKNSQGGDDPDSGEHRQYVLGAESRVDQVGFKGAYVSFRNRQLGPKLLQERNHGPGRLFPLLLQPAAELADHRVPQLLEETSRLIQQPVSHPGRQDHQHEECAHREKYRMFHIRP